MTKLIFLTTINPLIEDEVGIYSRLRFYSDTLVKIADINNINEIIIGYTFSNLIRSKKIYEKNNKIFDSESEKVVQKSFKENPEKYENCNILLELAKEHNIKVKFQYIKDIESSLDDLVFFGILNDKLSNLKDIIEMYSKIIKKSKGYYYLSSDAELTEHQYISISNVGYLQYLKNFDTTSILKSKLLGCITTEITVPDLLDRFESIGIPKSKVYYLPMIIDTKRRIDFNNKNKGAKNNRIMILSNLCKWSKYLELFENVKSHFDIYDSSIPLYRKKYISLVQEYEGNYKFHKFWTLSAMRDKLSEYTYYLGMSTPGTDRFTYKIIEASNAGTFCILPKLTLTSLGISKDFISSRLLEKYSDMFMLDVSSEENFRKSFSKIKDMFNVSKDEYENLLLKQYNFIKEYFEYNSENINECLKLIFK